MEWFNSLDTFLKTYWIIAGAASLIFIIQTIMTFIGLEASDGLNADFSADFNADFNGDTHFEGPFQLFSIRNLVNFFLGFGWGGICFYNTFSSKVWVSFFAFLTGVIFVFLFFFIIKQFLKLGKDNTFQIKDTLEKAADVYLAIPEAKSGKGKIQISVKGAFHEIDAMTEGERIPTGGKAQVINIIDNQTVLVIKL